MPSVTNVSTYRPTRLATLRSVFSRFYFNTGALALLRNEPIGFALDFVTDTYANRTSP